VVGISNFNNVEGVSGLNEEKITSVDASYIFRSPIVKAKLTGYYTKIEDANEISFYFADGVAGFFNNQGAVSNEFISEVLQGIDKKHIGAELGIEAQVTPTIKLLGVGSVGQYTYDNNPNLYLTADSQTVAYGESSLKDYKIAGGPQTAFSTGFEYRDPDFWFFGATANFFYSTYVDLSPLTRTKNFYSDPVDGLPFNDYDEVLARELLKQEKFDEAKNCTQTASHGRHVLAYVSFRPNPAEILIIKNIEIDPKGLIQEPQAHHKPAIPAFNDL